MRLVCAVLVGTETSGGSAASAPKGRFGAEGSCVPREKPRRSVYVRTRAIWVRSEFCRRAGIGGSGWRRSRDLWGRCRGRPAHLDDRPQLVDEDDHRRSCGVQVFTWRDPQPSGGVGRRSAPGGDRVLVAIIASVMFGGLVAAIADELGSDAESYPRLVTDTFAGSGCLPQDCPARGSCRRCGPWPSRQTPCRRGCLGVGGSPRPARTRWVSARPGCTRRRIR